MINRYQSSERWQRVRSHNCTWYESPDGKWRARRDVFKPKTWILERRVPNIWSDNGESIEMVATFRTLADCQESAEKR